MAFSELEIEAIKEVLNANPTAKIFLGSDSQRQKKKKIKYATSLVIHYIDENGIGKGAKVFTDILMEDAIKENLSRPFVRMMREVELVTELYMSLEDVLLERDVEIHLDVSPNKGDGSNVAYGAAVGYVKGFIGLDPVTKPASMSFAASCVADRYSK